MKLRVGNIPLLVNGFSLIAILNPRVSASAFPKQDTQYLFMFIRQFAAKVFVFDTIFSKGLRY